MTISTSYIKMFKATEMWYLRKLVKIPLTDRESNEEMLQLASLQRSFVKTIRKRQMTILGHIDKKDGIEKLALCGKIERGRSRGRQKILYIGSLSTFATKQQTTEVIHLTDNREEWRSLTIIASTRSDT